MSRRRDRSGLRRAAARARTRLYTINGAGRSRRYRPIAPIVAQRRNNFLRNEDLAAHRALLAFRQTGLRAGCSNRRNDFFRMSRRRDHDRHTVGIDLFVERYRRRVYDRACCRTGRRGRYDLDGFIRERPGNPGIVRIREGCRCRSIAVLTVTRPGPGRLAELSGDRPEFGCIGRFPRYGYDTGFPAVKFIGVIVCCIFCRRHACIYRSFTI